MTSDESKIPHPASSENGSGSREPTAPVEPVEAAEAADGAEAADAAGAADVAEGADEPTLPSESAVPESGPTLEEQLEAAREEGKALRERMLRVAADFENYRKRTARELEDVRRRATQEAVKTLLPVFDNLERATGHVDETTDARSMAEGLQMVHRQFLDTLGKLNIERIAAVGLPFDPTVHESIQYEHSDEHPAGTIMTELQPGYRMGEMLLRPSLVVVSRGPANEAESAEPEGDSQAEGDSQSAEG